MFIVNAARIGFLEDRKGMLKEGLDADFVVFDANPYAAKTEELSEIGVLTTVAGGRLVYGDLSEFSERGNERHENASEAGKYGRESVVEGGDAVTDRKGMQRKRKRAKSAGRKPKYVWLSFLSLGVIIVLWCILTYGGFLDKIFLPKPTEVIKAIAAMCQDGSLASNIFSSVRRVLVG